MFLAHIALGANLPSPAGPPDATLAAAAVRLSTLGRITARSSLYSTVPVGFEQQPRFVNAVVALETKLSPRRLLDALLAIEVEFGRRRGAGQVNGPRTLDLDILSCGDLVIGASGLEIPHPRFADRAFVLVPLHEIASGFRDPRSGRTVAELLQALRGAPSTSPAHAIESVVQIESRSWNAVVDRAPAGGSWRPGADPRRG